VLTNEAIESVFNTLRVYHGDGCEASSVKVFATQFSYGIINYYFDPSKRSDSGF